VLRSFASLALRSLPLIWIIALAAATAGFFLVLAGAAVAERSSWPDTGWHQTHARALGESR
jgi:hypothetical protein